MRRPYFASANQETLVRSVTTFVFFKGSTHARTTKDHTTQNIRLLGARPLDHSPSGVANKTVSSHCLIMETKSENSSDL